MLGFDELWEVAEEADKRALNLVKELDSKNLTVFYESIEKAAKLAKKARKVRNAVKNIEELTRLLET